ncbi:MAG: tetratricopeptide repeat protein [Gemmatimonadales bacterium]
MSYGPELDRLATRWADQPGSTCFAPLAEGLRKSGALPEAAAVATRGVALLPGYLPGHLVLARIYRDLGQWRSAEVELRAALAIDADHPVVLDGLGELAGRSGITAVAAASTRANVPVVIDSPAPVADDESGDLVFSDALDDGPAHAVDSLVVTESLAALYWRQGHHQQAITAFEALLRRDPDNADLAARCRAVRAEFDATRPAPYDVAESGGVAVRDWLRSVAAKTAGVPQPISGFDAFYETSAPPAEPTDLAAFQAWLLELDR